MPRVAHKERKGPTGSSEKEEKPRKDAGDRTGVLAALPFFHAAFPGPEQLQEVARPFPPEEKAPLHRPGCVVIRGDTSSNHVAALVFKMKEI